MNPKVATLVPLAHLHLIQEDDYFMALAHAAENPEYLKFYRDRAREGKYVILDNSAVELGGPVDFRWYYEKAIKMNASEIMLPDIFQDAGATIAADRSALKEIVGNWMPKMDIMIIPQGKTKSEWLDCAMAQYAMMAEYNVLRPTIGISCRYIDMFDGIRSTVVPYLHRMIPGAFKIHFLGCYADPREEIRPFLGMNGYIQGVDSSYPSVYAQHGYRLTPEMFSMPRPARHIDFINDHYDEGLLKWNIEAWRVACQSLPRP